MANIKAMKKDLKRNAKARTVNTGVKSSLKTYVKKVRTATAAGDAEKTASAVVLAAKALDKAVAKGIIHKNQAARRKSRAMKAANKVVAGTVVVAKKEKAPKTIAQKATAKAATKKAVAAKKKAE